MPLKIAQKIAERCRDVVFKEQIPHPTSRVSQVLTVSIGVGTIIPGHKDIAMDFIALVDQRLYAAKNRGRNRIVEVSV